MILIILSLFLHSNAVIITEPCCYTLNHIPAIFHRTSILKKLVNNSRIIPADPSNGCNNNIDNIDIYNNSIVLIERGGCNFTEKILNVQNGGAIGAIVYNDKDASRWAVAMKGTKEDIDKINIPSVFVSNPSGKQILELIDNHTAVYASLTDDHNILYPFSLNFTLFKQIAEFSISLFMSVIFFSFLIQFLFDVIDKYEMDWRIYGIKQIPKILITDKDICCTHPNFQHKELFLQQCIRNSHTCAVCIDELLPAEATAVSVNGKGISKHEHVDSDANAIHEVNTHKDNSDNNSMDFCKDNNNDNHSINPSPNINININNKQTCAPLTIQSVSEHPPRHDKLLQEVEQKVENVEIKQQKQHSNQHVELMILPCNHIYHSSCITPWLQNKSLLCPLCKSEAISRNDVLSPLMMRIIHWKANVVTASNVLDMSDYALRYCIAIAFVISYIIANIILTHYVY